MRKYESLMADMATRKLVACPKRWKPVGQRRLSDRTGFRNEKSRQRPGGSKACRLFVVAGLRSLAVTSAACHAMPYLATLDEARFGRWHWTVARIGRCGRSGSGRLVRETASL